MFQRIFSRLLYNKKRYLWLWQDYSKNQKLDAAASLMYKAVKYVPYDMDIRWWLSITLLKQGNYPEALFQLEYMIANWPNTPKKTQTGWFAQIHALIARCQLMLGNVSDVELHLSITQNMAPWDLDACKTLIDLYQSTSRFDKIPFILDQYIEMYPQVYPPYVWRARHIHYMCYDPAGALEWYQKAIARTTEEMLEYSKRSRTSQGMFWVFIDNYVEALVECGKDEDGWRLIQSYKNNPEIDIIAFQEIVFDFYLYTKNYSAAEQIAISLIKQDKNMPVYWELLAHVQAKQNRLDDADKSIKNALSLSTEYITIYDILAQIQMAQSKWEFSIKTYKKLIEFSPLETEWLENCGWCYKNNGELEKAKELYEKVTTLDPLDAIAWADLGEIYFQLGQNDLAFSACQQALSFNRLNTDKQEQAEQILHKTRN